MAEGEDAGAGDRVATADGGTDPTPADAAGGADEVADGEFATDGGADEVADGGADAAVPDAAADESGDGLAVERVVGAPEGDIPIVTDRALPAVLLDHVDERPDEVAVRWKRYGIWEEYSWADYYRRVEAFALGLADLGFGDDDVLFTIGYNRPHQLWAWLGAQALGGVAAPNYEDMLPEEIETQLELLQPRVVYAEDQEMVDKVLAVADGTPVHTVVYRDDKGMFRYEDHTDPRVVSYGSVADRGRERLESGDVREGDLRERIEALDGQRPAVLSPTSGTTGTPKRVVLTHANFVNLANAAIEIDPLPPGSDYFSYLPMAWVGEQMILLAAAFVGGWTANFPEQPETESEDLREIGPEIIFSSPRTYEGWVADVKAKVENTTPLKRWVYERAVDVGHRYAEYTSGEKRDEEPPLGLRLAHELAYWTTYRPILDKLGIKRAKNVYTGGGPLGEEHFQYYHALGVNLKQIWGQSEVCGFVTMHRDGDVQVDTVGEVFPNVEVGITPAGELLVRGPVVTEGYYNQPEKTAEALEDVPASEASGESEERSSSGRWLHTDDFGAITDDGHVKVFDRMDDVIELADGTAVAPISVETKLKFNPYVKEALVVGDGRDHLAAVLNVRFDNVAEWADQRDIQYTGYRDLSQKRPVLALLAGVVADVNADLEGHEVRRFVSLFKEFDPDDGELTRTGKLRRAVIGDRYAGLVDALYAGDEEIATDVTITYQDGREATERGEMPVVDLYELADGTSVAPLVAEATLDDHPLVDRALVVGDGRDHLAALLALDADAAAAWADDEGVEFGDLADLAGDSALVDRLEAAVEAASADLPGPGVRRFLALPGSFDADATTPSGHLRRSLLGERYGDEVAALYDGRETATVESGSGVRAEVPVRDVGEGVADAAVTEDEAAAREVAAETDAADADAADAGAAEATPPPGDGDGGGR